jgi:hypothetical protein
VAPDQPLDLGLLRRVQQALLVRLAPTRLADQALRPSAAKRWQMSMPPVRLRPTCPAIAR